MKNHIIALLSVFLTLIEILTTNVIQKCDLLARKNLSRYNLSVKQRRKQEALFIYLICKLSQSTSFKREKWSVIYWENWKIKTNWFFSKIKQYPRKKIRGEKKRIEILLLDMKSDFSNISLCLIKKRKKKWLRKSKAR